MTRAYYIIGIFLGMFLPFFGWAASSLHYNLEPFNIGNSGGQTSASSQYSIEKQQVGDTAIGHSSSSNFNIQHGYLYPDETENVLVDLRLIPEKRIPSSGNNSTQAMLTLYASGGTVPQYVFDNLETDTARYLQDISLEGVIPGTYDLAIKGYAHLTKKISNQSLAAGKQEVDFSRGGTEYLLCGDTYTNATYPHGDDAVNAVDVTHLVSQWAQTDGGVSDNRADVDENQQINSLDMAKMVNNYGLSGKK